MRPLNHLAIIMGLLLAGCATHPASVKPKPSATAKEKAGSGSTPGASLTVTNGSRVIRLVDAATVKVASVNLALRFVVLDYSLMRLPQVGDELAVFHQGAHVGRLKISGPVLNNHVVADVLEGNVQVGDEARQP